MKVNKWTVIFYCLSAVSLIVAGIIVFNLWNLNLLEISAFAAVVVGILLMHVLVFSLIRGYGKKQGKIRLLVILLLLCLLFAGEIVSINLYRQLNEVIHVDETPEVATEEKKIEAEPFIVYLSGSDTRNEKIEENSRSDVNILAVVNPEKKKVLLVNTPRDYYVSNPNSPTRELDKLTHCGIYGINCSIKALEELYKCHVDYYAQINFSGFETLIDTLGGITIYSDIDDGVFLKQGANQMNGEVALDFARERYSYSEGDNARGKHQMMVIQAIAEKTKTEISFSNYNEILTSLEGMFRTNMQIGDIAKFARIYLGDQDNWNIQAYAVTGTGGSEYTYSMPGMKAYVMYQNPETVKEASDLIQDVLTETEVTN